VGRGKTSTVLRYIPGRFVRDVYHRETCKCRCGEYIVTAPAPEKALEGTRYDEGFVAHLMVSKCGDSLPLYRLEKQYRRAGINISRATMNDLLHRHAELLEPVGKCLTEEIAKSDVVLADETSIKLQSAKGKAWMWAFLAGNLIAYRFSPSRSGKTPRDVLGTSQGTLLVDAYTGYNSVTGVEGRERAGCLAHARRKLFEARDADEGVQGALELIQDVYRVEHDAKEQGIAQSESHLEMRKKRAAPAMGKLKVWLDERDGLHSPKSPIASAIGYAKNNWVELTRFLEDARIPVDNNRSEAALRVVALGRKNFLFVGHESAGENLATIYSLIATCDACGVNPMEYLPDVMRRLSSHPASQIRELLPDRWQSVSA
jgi:transposase